MHILKLVFSVLPVVVLCACAADAPRHGEVVTLRAGQAPPGTAPAPGTVWRLDENDLRSLSPAPLVPAPPPPRLPPPPRPNASYPPPYYAPAPLPYWGPPY